MEEQARDIRLISLPGGDPDAGDGPGDPRFSDAELDAARELADYHRMLAAELDPRSQLRGLVLRCAGHWSRLGAIPRNGLVEAEHRGRD